MKSTYYNIVCSLEHLYRLFLEIVKRELDRMGVYDINSVQVIMIYNISEQEVSVGELVSRGLYHGSNVSYNLKKLIQTGYVIQKPSEHDKRSLHIKLSQKGLEIFKSLDICFEAQAKKFENIFPNQKTIGGLYKNLKLLESFWVNSETLK